MKNSLIKIFALKNYILEENFFRPAWYSVFLNPYFINRMSLYREMCSFASGIGDKERVLDVGCGIKPYRHLFKTREYVGIDIAGGGHADDAKHTDVFYDGKTIPFEEQQFDALICTQVLEHTEDPEALLRECARVLKPHGQIFISMPFVYPEHEKPFDFRRFTRFEHKKLFEKNNFSSIRIKQTTGFWGTFGQILVVYLFEGITFRAPILKGILSVLVFAPIQIIALALDGLFGKTGATMDYVVTAIKK